MQVAKDLNFKMTKENIQCPYFERCSARFDLDSGQSCYDESFVENCTTHKSYKRRSEIREEVARRTVNRKRNIVGILTGNI